jgi:hypothetical protein
LAKSKGVASAAPFLLEKSRLGGALFSDISFVSGGKKRGLIYFVGRLP